jgi:hypothetical protein
MGKPKDHLDLRYQYNWKEVPGWNECPRCHQIKQGLLRHKDRPEGICRECLKELDVYDRCEFGWDPEKLERKTDVQIRRCLKKAREMGKGRHQ